MDRVSALFTAHARIVTAVIAILVAVVLQLDAVTLVNRLSTDDKLRETLVQHAIDHPEKYGPQSAGSPATTSLDALNASAETLKQRGLDDLLNANLIEIFLQLGADPNQKFDDSTIWRHIIQNLNSDSAITAEMYKLFLRHGANPFLPELSSGFSGNMQSLINLKKKEAEESSARGRNRKKSERKRGSKWSLFWSTGQSGQ